jgi:cell wall assembly regulator SMI1
MSRQMRIEELEVSVRTAGFLAGLGVETVGELVSLPEIRAPKLVAAELTEVLEELGVLLEGRLVVDEPVTLAATGDLEHRWKTIVAWLEEQRPDVLETFRPPTTASAIAAAEEELGRPLPDSYKRFLAIHDGQEDASPMVGTCSLFPVGSLAGEFRSLHALFEAEGAVDEDLAGPGVRPVECAHGWVPIGRSARGRDFLCIDLDPASGGRPGQIVQLSIDFDDRPLVAASFADLLSLFYTQLQTGEIETD